MPHAGTALMEGRISGMVAGTPVLHALLFGPAVFLTAPELLVLDVMLLVCRRVAGVGRG